MDTSAQLQLAGILLATGSGGALLGWLVESRDRYRVWQRKRARAIRQRERALKRTPTPS